MANNVKKAIILMFVIIGFIACLLYAVPAGVSVDEYEGIMYDWDYIINSFFGTFWPVLGMGLIMYFIVDRK